MSNCNHTVT
uniref:Uncharacterized protein n=1 Tax=Arundo donax TaxID=35708 RepID=A0A0A9HC98_ARUDO